MYYEMPWNIVLAAAFFLGVIVAFLSHICGLLKGIKEELEHIRNKDL